MENSMENAEIFRIKNSEFVISAADKGGFIKDEFKQIVFSGRSNVGKSSLINSLLNRKKLAKISQTPGKTKLINYFLVNQNFYFVDIPGYGYAKVPKSEKNKWKKLIGDYFETEENISAVIMIIDIRHDPMDSDIQMIKYFTSLGLRQLLIANKSDKLSNNKVSSNVAKLKKMFSRESIFDIIPYSSTKNRNREKVLDYIGNMFLN